MPNSALAVTVTFPRLAVARVEVKGFAPISPLLAAILPSDDGEVSAGQGGIGDRERRPGRRESDARRAAALLDFGPGLG